MPTFTICLVWLYDCIHRMVCCIPVCDWSIWLFCFASILPLRSEHKILQLATTFWILGQITTKIHIVMIRFLSFSSCCSSAGSWVSTINGEASNIGNFMIASRYALQSEKKRKQTNKQTNKKPKTIFFDLLIWNIFWQIFWHALCFCFF